MLNRVLLNRDFSNKVRWRKGERLHHLFETRCDRFSEDGGARHHIAVDTQDHAWTYKELEERANQTAGHLKNRGLGAGDTIGLLFDKSVYSYVSMLAVLKIHAAYVPLDPSFPEDRVAFIAGDAGLKAILTLSVYLEITETASCPALCLDKASAQIDLQEKKRPPKALTGLPANELCYIIYTSGSTGRPKGVPIEHSAICNFVRVASEVYGYRSSDRVYQGLTIAFDFAVEEIWVPLITGATLVPNQTGSSLIGSDLSNFLKTRRVTAMCCVPTLLATIDEALPDLRLLIVSGEACPGDLITRWYSPDRTILNAYGPTETTVTATLAISRPNEPVTIGKPLPTYAIVILEPEKEKVLPFGETGEIAIAGAGVAKGYLNRDDQTRKAFIKDFVNIPDNPSGLIYRSGDLGLINERGEIEYRGRIDTQVKIRGYRIELTEIESVILQLPEIAQVVVNTFEPLPGIKELVAYYTLKPDGKPLSQEALIDTLRSQLPDYMVPAYYELLNEIPLMASDKADRKALPKPSGTRRNTGANHVFVDPETPLEKEIAGVLSSFLKIEAVSAKDNFFDDLGANSLLMAQFSSLLRRKPGFSDFSMREVYTFPSVRKLAGFLESSDRNKIPLKRDVTVHKATGFQYISTGVFQFAWIMAWIYTYIYILFKGYSWIIEAPRMLTAYAHTVMFTTATFAGSVLIPVVLKWLLIGRWRADEFPVWGLKYLRFWLVRFLTRVNPMAAFAGSPLYNGYLKLLGARVSWNALILSGFPVVTDLFSAGSGAVISKRAIITGYRAESGRIKTGKITIGRDVFVGESSVLDIDTVMEGDSELAHASSLQSGQRLKAGKTYHGSPARTSSHGFRQIGKDTAGVTRMVIYSLLQLILPFLIFLPVPMLIIYHFIGAENTGGNPGITPILLETRSLSYFSDIVVWSSLLYFAAIPAGLVFIFMVPRILNLFLKEEKVYPLYGFHYIIHGLVSGISNSAFYNVLLGDSSFIIYFLKLIGYKFNGLRQTGSNFGLSHQHDNPFLSEFGKGSMISDGFVLQNADYSAGSFKLSRAVIGKDCFFGNNIVYPAQSKAGHNCLLATKVMVPVNGPTRKNTGLLGSPCFEIPRSVRRDTLFNKYSRKEKLRESLKKKNTSNLITIFLLLLSNLFASIMLIAGWFYTYPRFTGHEAIYGTIFLTISEMVFFIYYGFLDRATLGFRRLKPEYCSIYDKYYWTHERYWKLGIANRGFLQGTWALMNGTPFKGSGWRMLGVKVGKKLFDDGTYIPEKSLVTLGDYCTLNNFSVLQCHSLEDGTFKSDHTVIGNNCTVGVNCFIHYGVKMGSGAALEPDSFLMKGESPAEYSLWLGNPAKAVLSTDIAKEPGYASQHSQRCPD